jgi:competence protein ComEA
MKALSIAALGLALALVGGDAHAAKRKSSVKVSGVVNLNQATASQLDLLPGVGDKAAKRIIEHRSKAPFKRAEELVNVKGFGKKKFEKLKPHLAISGPTTIAVAKASPEAEPSLSQPRG